MLTDDDLIRELESGFRDETAGLRYAGRVPAPPRRGVVPWTAVPVAAAAAVVLVLPRLDGPDGPGAALEPPTATGAATPSGPLASGGPPRPASPGARLVTDTIELAGFSFRYEHPRGTPLPVVYLALGARPPADATPVDGLDTAEAAWVTRAWVGTDPVSGDAALWVQSPGDGVGAHVMFWSPDLGPDQLAEMLRTGSTAEEVDH